MIAGILTSRDQTTNALKTIYRAVGLLAEGAELEMVMTFDLDHAECVSGDPAYAASVRADEGLTDCLPPECVLRRLQSEDFA